MPRNVPGIIVILVGLLLLVDFVVINPTLVDVSNAVLRLVVLLAAAAGITGASFLVMRHGRAVLDGSPHRLESSVLIVGLVAMLATGLYPGSQGAADPAVRWMVTALLAPLVASLFAMLFVFLLVAVRRGMLLRSRQMRVMLLAAAVVIVLLLPLGGQLGGWLAAVAAWSEAVPIGAVFRGLLIGVGILVAVQATRILLSVNPADD